MERDTPWAPWQELFIGTYAVPSAPTLTCPWLLHASSSAKIGRLVLKVTPPSSLREQKAFTPACEQ
jgi:hypothetical protein